MASDNHHLFDRDESRGNAPAGGGTTLVATSAIVARGNDRRKRLTIINDGDTVMYVAMSDEALANLGFRLNALGGVFTIESDALGYLWVGPVSIICAAARGYTLTEET